MRRDGFALILVLVIVAAVELIALSTLALATHETVAVSAAEHTLPASRAAEAALRRVVRDWPHLAIDSLRISQMVTLPDTSAVVTVRRNTAGQYLGIAYVPSGGSWVREAAVLERLDIVRAIEEASQAVVSRGPVSTSGTRFTTAPVTCTLPASPGGADTLLAAIPQYAFGGQDWQELSSLADSGFVFTHGDAVLAAGTHDGVFVVHGNLTVVSGAVVSGLAVVSGNLVVEDGVHMSGSIIVRGAGPSTIGAADLVFSPCDVARVLYHTPASRRLVQARRRFIPAF